MRRRHQTAQLLSCRSVNTVLLSLSLKAFSTASVLLDALEQAEKVEVASRTSANRMAGQLLRECEGDARLSAIAMEAL